MAFPIKQIKAKLQEFGLTENLDSAAEWLCAAHSTALDAIKEQRDEYKAKAEKLPDVENRLAELEKDGGKDKWKVKYDALKEDFESYKSEQEKSAHAEKVKTAYTKLLKDAGIADKRLAAVLKVSDLDSVKLTDDGKIENAAELSKAIKSEWADFIPSAQEKGAGGENPPANNPSSAMTKEQIYAKDDRGRYVMNASERQTALAQLHANEQKGS